MFNTPPKKTDTQEHNDDLPCPYCGKLPGPDEKWVECTKCLKWSHNECAGVGDSVIDNLHWKCGVCEGSLLPFTGPVEKSNKQKGKNANHQPSCPENQVNVRALSVRSGRNGQGDQDLQRIHDSMEKSAKLTEQLLQELVEQRKEINRLSDEVARSRMGSRAGSVNSGVISRSRREQVPNEVEQQRSVRHVPVGSLVDLSPPVERSTPAHVFGTARPTPAQLSARHTLGKDLPKFSGLPRDWPIFSTSFTESTIACGFSHNENLVRLQRCLEDPAKKMVFGLLRKAENVPIIIDLLRTLYGRPELVVDDLVEQIFELPSPKADNFGSIVEYAVQVHNVCTILEDDSLEDYRRNPSLVKQIIKKLPSNLQMRWADEQLNANDMVVFGRWLHQIAMNLCTRLPAAIKLEDKSKRKSGLVGSHNIVSKSCQICDKNCTSVKECDKFKDASVKDRYNMAKKKRLCFRCLCQHDLKSCNDPVKCQVEGCTANHHPLLHYRKSEVTPEPVQKVNCAYMGNSDSCAFRYVPVTLINGKIKLETFAFLDEGSSTTLMSQATAKRLGLKGVLKPIEITWTDNSCRIESQSEVVRLQIRKKNGKQLFPIEAQTVKILKTTKQSLNYEEMAEKYPHLRKLPVESYNEVEPALLIGQDNWYLGLPLKTKHRKAREPMAAKSRLGWAVFSRKDNHTYANFYHKCSAPNDQDLYELVKSYFRAESLGVNTREEVLENKEEKLARSVMSSTLRRIGDRFEIGLPWNDEVKNIPDSRPMALRRMYKLEQSLKPPQMQALNDLIRDYVSKGYTRQLSEEELAVKQDRVWYLPIFLVHNPNKPEKVRAVWDAAAKVNDVSLNSMLLSGPDLLTELLGILLRFREGKVAVAGDIKEMFLRILVRMQDTHALRFIWRFGDSSVKPQEFAMQVLIFGATCSPSISQFVKNVNAKEWENQYPEASATIIRDTYVDDWLKSFATEEEAVRVTKEVVAINKDAGFEMHKFLSNSNHLLQELNSINPKDALDLQVGEQSHKVLGMWYQPTSDIFKFSLKYNKGDKSVLEGKRAPSKREVLRILASIYDPLGLLAYYLVHLKILLQDLWRMKIHWDAAIPQGQYNIFLSWLKLLPNIEQLHIPRGYFNYFESMDEVEVQLHIFVDASKDAEAGVAYFRCTKDNKVTCTLVTAKTKVAPLKLRSIPELEVEGALIGARLAASICKHHDIEVNKTILWCDSLTALAWIKMQDIRKLKRFVAFRVAEIQESSVNIEWRYVPSCENVADDSTKRSKHSTMTDSDRWFTGPKFLLQPESSWPKNPSDQELQAVQMQEETKVIAVHHQMTTKNFVDVYEFSSWEKLRTTMTAMFCFLRKKSAANYNELNVVDEMVKAEKYLFKLAQKEIFGKDIRAAQNQPDATKILRRNNTLLQLSAYIDAEGILRVQGRIDAAVGVNADAKRPIILPRSHHITNLIVKFYHEKYRHIHHDVVINELRQKFYVPAIRVVLNKVKSNCLMCKLKRRRIVEPLMGELPLARLATYEPPFTFTGIDYFGPLYVTVRRSKEKRWGVMFTCLTTRAVHIEIAYKLDTDSCLMSIRSFMMIRGQPKEFRSDRGTNFIAAEKVLCEEFENIDQKEIGKEMNSLQIKWVFNPPGAPHMGGSWERMIRSFKRALYAIQPSLNWNDPLLRVSMMEAAQMLNSRPLTYLPIDSDEAEAITPNHFLHGSSNGVRSTGQLPQRDLQSAHGYIAAQQFKEKLWKRFVREYLPDLVRRTKNFNVVEPLKVGDIVVLCDENLACNAWPKGKIVEVFTGKDGQVRSAKVHTGTTTYHRPTSKLAKLDINQ